MSKNTMEITLCNTCVRDNAGEGVFTKIESVEKIYREQLNNLDLKSPVIKLQNCFNACEVYHCVRVDHLEQQKGFVLKKISDPQKIEAICSWVKSDASEVPEFLKEHLVETQLLAS